MAGLSGGQANPTIGFILQMIFKQVNLFHLSYLEVWSQERTLPTAAVNDLKAFVKEMPTSSIGSDLSLMSLLAPIMMILQLNHWSTVLLTTNYQSVSACYV